MGQRGESGFCRCVSHEWPVPVAFNAAQEIYTPGAARPARLTIPALGRTAKVMAGGSLIETVTDLSVQSLDRYDDIIDVRSPAEFAEDHVPGAINLPVLDNEERARVGTIYKQVSHFEARRVGAGLVAANIGRHLGAALSDKPADYNPLIYCWRGGMRSGAMATILSRVGWRCSLLKGGYRSWRRHVVAELREEGALLPMILIDGQTGTAKTEIIRRLMAQGAPAIDLEGLAAHRGSVFGLMGAPQPAQKGFESRLWDQIRRFDPDTPIIAEAESSTIGRLHIPRRLWDSMQAAPRIEITASVEARARYLVTAYSDLTEDREAILNAINRLRSHHSKAQIAAWREMAESSAYEALAADLARQHYDPAYLRSRKTGGEIKQIALPDTSPEALDKAARQVMEIAGG